MLHNANVSFSRISMLLLAKCFIGESMRLNRRGENRSLQGGAGSAMSRRASARKQARARNLLDARNAESMNSKQLQVDPLPMKHQRFELHTLNASNASEKIHRKGTINMSDAQIHVNVPSQFERPSRSIVAVYVYPIILLVCFGLSAACYTGGWDLREWAEETENLMPIQRVVNDDCLHTSTDDDKIGVQNGVRGAVVSQKSKPARSIGCPCN
mmetsp:Transcript_106026/g.167435  ORF Transcript_106026/g.167435 Transcript_106026/m.167435 type:complete len:213 (+) Transcript_106026:82-720(+)